MYHVTGIGITATLLYLLSYYLYRAGFYPIHVHKNLWNTILAAAFIITALAGLFLALQASYKWELSFVKTILKWHVEFGIAMAFSGMFHFIWHFSYYVRMFPRQANQETAPPENNISYSNAGMNLFIVGFVSTSFQLLLLREMMNISGGFELISGTFLASWLIGSAIGSTIAGGSRLNDIRKINFSFSLSPAISLLMLLVLSGIFLNSGQTPSFLLSLIFSFLVLIPFCLISGFTFIRLMRIAKASHGTIPGKSFAIETAGGILAGIVVPVLTSGILNTYQLILLIILLSNTWVLLSFSFKSPVLNYLTKFVVLILSCLIIVFNTDIFFRKILSPAMGVKDTEDTPYGNITTGIYKGEESIYYDQRLLSYSGNAAEKEENVHYAMLQHDNPRKIILISGSLKSCLPEIMKYNISRVIYIERDPLLAGMESIDTEHNQKVQIANDDAYRHIRKMDEKADVILMLVPPPSNLLLNRYYSSEFFHEAAAKLNEGGVFMCSPGPADTYLNRESIELYSSIFKSLKSEFGYVLPIAGNKLYLLASDKELSTGICHLTEVRKISNVYVSPDFLADDLISRRSEEITSLMKPDINENKAAYPVAYRSYQSYNFGKSPGEKTAFVIIAAILFAIPAFSAMRRNPLMFSCASALSGFEIILLLLLQIIEGNMYQLTGLLIAALMAGLSVGAGSGFMKNTSLNARLLTILFFYIVAGLLFNFLSALTPGIPSVVILMMLAFIPGLLTGNIFNELTAKKDDASGIYSADLSGSALGFIIISAIAIPLVGLQLSIFLLSGFIFTGFVFGTVGNKY